MRVAARVSVETSAFIRACSAAETWRTGVEIRAAAGTHAAA
jgi:hypothetical protein